MNHRVEAKNFDFRNRIPNHQHLYMSRRSFFVSGRPAILCLLELCPHVVDCRADSVRTTDSEFASLPQRIAVWLKKLREFVAAICRWRIERAREGVKDCCLSAAIRTHDCCQWMLRKIHFHLSETLKPRNFKLQQSLLCWSCYRHHLIDLALLDIVNLLAD